MIINIPENSDFSIHNIPFGIFTTNANSIKRIGVAIGEHVLDLVELAKLDVFDFDTSVFECPFLNDFIQLGKPVTNKVRTDIQTWLKDDSSVLADKDSLFVLQSDATMHLPVRVGDYTDFYSSIEHAMNLGIMFRGPENALMPNWKHIPVGYHGRASSIIVSGQDIHRPKGQVMPPDADKPIFKACGSLDFELEVAFITGKNTKIGDSISTTDAEDYIFGLVLFNDWSARDIQKWEYVPLGPFLGKSFASSASPWVVTLEALEPFRVPSPKQDPEVLPYLKYDGVRNIDIALSVDIIPEGGKPNRISDSNFKYMYWNMAQQLTHHTVNGCNINVGDMMASGTISGKDEKSYGSMIELCKAGKKPYTMNDGTTRTFLNDGDTVTMKGTAEKDGIRVGFGEVTAKVLPAK